MSELRKANTDEPYFLTCTVVGWIDIFTRTEYCNMVVKSLQHAQEEKGLKLFAYVIMSNHLHLIAQHEDAQLSKVIGEFKSFVSRQIMDCIASSEHESRKSWLNHLFQYFGNLKKADQDRAFWQPTNHPILLYNETIFEQKRAYIELNPVRAGLVNEETAWVYSSANPNSSLKMLEY